MPDTDTIDATDLPPIKTGAGGYGADQPVPYPAPGTDTDAPGGVTSTSSLVGPRGSLTYDALRRSSESDAASSRLDQRLERDRAERDRAYRQEAAGPDSLPPKWDAATERQKTSTGPMEAFGSVGMIFALAASAFTKAPMTSALKAGGAVLEAIHAGDEERYKSAYQAWKDNTELALKRFQMERDLFEDANKLSTSDINEWRTKQTEIAGRFDNKKIVTMLEAGMDKDVIDIQNSQIKGATEMMRAKDEFETFDLRKDLLKIEGDQFKAEHPDASQADVLLHQLQAKEDMVTGKKTLEEQVLADARQQYWEKNGKPMPYQDQVKVVQNMKASGGAANIALQRFLEENPGATGAQIQSFLSQGHTARSAPAMALGKFMQEHPDATSEDIKQFAAEYSQEQKAIRDFATGKQGQAINSISVAIDHLDTLRSLSDALKNKDFPAFNRISQRWAQETGNPAPTNFDAAKQIIGQEIIKSVVAGGGGVTERNQAQDALSRANSPAQINGVIDTIEKLMAGQLRGQKRTYETTTGRTDFDQRISSRALQVLDRLSGEGGAAQTSGVTPSGIKWSVEP